MPEQKRFQKKKLDANDYKNEEKVAKIAKKGLAILGIGGTLIKLAPKALRAVVKTITKT